MSKSTRGASRARPLVSNSGATFLPGIVDGERVVIAKLKKGANEAAVKQQIRVALATSGVLVWNNVVALAKLRSGAWSHVGLCVGSADLIGLVPPYGRFLGIETKRPKKAHEREAQKRWIELVRRWGGVAGFARSVEEALALANEARRLP